MTPLYIGPANAVYLVGLAWRRVRDNARALGIQTVKVGKAELVPAAAFMAAFTKTGDQGEPKNPTPDEAAAYVRRQLGRERRAKPMTPAEAGELVRERVARVRRGA
jgi:hypothetical protein